MGRWSKLKGPLISFRQLQKSRTDIPLLSTVPLFAFHVIVCIVLNLGWTLAGDDATTLAPHVAHPRISSAILSNGELDLYEEKDNVVLLNVDDIQSSIYHSKKAWFVEFYSHKCPHSQDFAPLWKQLAQDFGDYGDLAVLAGIDCIQEKNAAVCSDFGILQYPSILAFAPYSDVLVEDNSTTDASGVKATKSLNKGILMLRSEDLETMKMFIMDELVKYFPKLSIRNKAENDPYAAYKAWSTQADKEKVAKGRSVASNSITDPQLATDKAKEKDKDKAAETDKEKNTDKDKDKTAEKDKDSNDENNNEIESNAGKNNLGEPKNAPSKVLEDPEPMSSPYQSYDKTSFNKIPSTTYYGPGDTLPSNFDGSGAGGAGMYVGRLDSSASRHQQNPRPSSDPFHGGGLDAFAMAGMQQSPGMMGNPGSATIPIIAETPPMTGQTGMQQASSGMEGMSSGAIMSGLAAAAAGGEGSMPQSAGNPRADSVKQLVMSELNGGGEGLNEADESGPAVRMEDSGTVTAEVMSLPAQQGVAMGGFSAAAGQPMVGAVGGVGAAAVVNAYGGGQMGGQSRVPGPQPMGTNGGSPMRGLMGRQGGIGQTMGGAPRLGGSPMRGSMGGAERMGGSLMGGQMGRQGGMGRPMGGAERMGGNSMRGSIGREGGMERTMGGVPRMGGSPMRGPMGGGIMGGSMGREGGMVRSMGGGERMGGRHVPGGQMSMGSGEGHMSGPMLGGNGMIEQGSGGGRHMGGGPGAMGRGSMVNGQTGGGGRFFKRSESSDLNSYDNSAPTYSDSTQLKLSKKAEES